MSRIIVGLSGGVDSAVAALLLQEQGHQVTPVFMKNWDEDDDQGYCPARQDLEDARAVCSKLGLELHTVSFSAQYWDKVFRLFLDEYQGGRTPNPDIICNQEIKFRAFLDYATGLGADCIATGHYARVVKDGKFKLLKGADRKKDQTYFLHTLDQSQLGQSLFPVGHLEKQALRRLAAKAGLPVCDKKDSTGICFIGERKFSDFLARYIPESPGEIRSLDGKLLGTHRGLMFYTIGQRHGLGIGGHKEATGEPWYVAGKDMDENILRVVQGTDHPGLYKRRLSANQLHWISGVPAHIHAHFTARIRYQQDVQDCTILEYDAARCLVEFSTPQRAITPGQSVVFYDSEECLGGGVIEDATG